MTIEDVASRGERDQFTAGARDLPLPEDDNIRRGGRVTALLRGLRELAVGEISKERARGTGFLLVPVFMGLGALTYYAWPVEPAFPVTIAAAVAALVAMLLARDRPLMLFLAGAVAAALSGAVFAQAEALRASTTILGAEVTTRLTGKVAVIEHQADGRLRLTLDVISTERPVLRHAPERVRVSARRLDPAIRPGDSIAGLVRLFPPQGPVRPEGYDFSFASFFDGRGATGFFMGDPMPVASPGPAPFSSRLMAWVENTRLAIAGRIEDQLPGGTGQIASALITGIRAGIPEEVNEDLRKTGLAHILSISGLHMALVALTIMVSIRSVFALFPVFASNHPIKKYAAAIALIASGLYLFISGMGVAAQRSFIMLAIMLLAVMFDRSALTMRNLALAAIVVLIVAPHEIVGPSFQMSFAATAALIAGYAAWSGRRSNSSPPPKSSAAGFIWRKLLVYAGGLAMTSLLAGGATTLYGIWHFQRASPLSLLANLMVMPIVSVLVMPFAVLAAVLMPVGLDGLPLAVMDRGLEMVLACANRVAQMSPLDETGEIPKAAVVILTLALLIATISTTRIRILALPFVVAGVGFAAFHQYPDVFVSEDARLVGLRLPDGSLAVNRMRSSGFTTENWMRAIGTDRIGRPGKARPGASLAEAAGTGFICEGENCLARAGNGSAVAIAENAAAAAAFCPIVSVLIVQDPTVSGVCEDHPDVLVLTGQDLAKRGAAEIRLPEQGDEISSLAAILRHAIPTPYRPWHEHRAFSRAARGLGPPYRRETGAIPARGRPSPDQAGATGPEAGPVPETLSASDIAPDQ